MTATTSGRPDPRGCTLADLLALTLGAAIAASLKWYSGELDSTTIAGRAAPAWFVWANGSIELLRKSGVALIPVILQRRWRYGGPLRPVEYLPILVGLEQIFLSMWTWPVFGILYKDPQAPSRTLVSIEAYRAWQLSQVTIGIAAALLVAYRRKRPPDWISGFLIAVAWNRLTVEGEIYYQEWGNHLITSFGWPASTVGLLSAALVQGPIGSIIYLPTGIALVDLGRAGGRTWTWVERAATWLILPLPLFSQARYLSVIILGPRPIDLGHALHLGSTVASLGVAYLLARFFEPAWRRLLEGSTYNPISKTRY